MALPLALGLALALAAAGPQAAPDGRAWTAVSADTRVLAEQVPVGRGCRVKVTRDAKLLWSVSRCLAGRDDPRFVSNDGQRLLVLHAFPKQAGGVKRALGGELFERERRVASFAVGRFVADVRPLVMTSKHFYWLEGAMGQPGLPPGLTSGGAGVELTTLDRRTFVVGFDGRVKQKKT